MLFSHTIYSMTGIKTTKKLAILVIASFYIISKNEFSTNHRANCVAAVAVVVAIPVSIVTVKAQAVGELPTISVKRNRPIVTVIAYVFDAAIATVASSREE